MEKPEWHHYDQNIFNILAKSSNKEAEKFAEKMSRELNTDLFSVGFKVVHTPSMYLEGIGLTTFPSAKKLFEEKLNEIISKIIELSPEKQTQEVLKLPVILMGEYLTIFRQLPELTPQELISKGEYQLTKMPNSVVAELSKATILDPVETLRNPETLNRYHNTICAHLAMDYVFQIQYDEILTIIFPSKEKRKKLLRLIYHGMFQGATDAIKELMNCSYFRAFDRFLNKISDFAKDIDPFYQDVYRQAKAYLENNKDLQDPYFIHFLICGFCFENRVHKVHSFTLEPPAKVRLRLAYATFLLNWINENMGKPFSFHYGKVYCFNNELELIDSFRIDEVSL